MDNLGPDRCEECGAQNKNLKYCMHCKKRLCPYCDEEHDCPGSEVLEND